MYLNKFSIDTVYNNIFFLLFFFGFFWFSLFFFSFFCFLFMCVFVFFFQQKIVWYTFNNAGRWTIKIFWPGLFVETRLLSFFGLDTTSIFCISALKQATPSGIVFCYVLWAWVYLCFPYSRDWSKALLLCCITQMSNKSSKRKYKSFFSIEMVSWIISKYFQWCISRRKTTCFNM